MNSNIINKVTTYKLKHLLSDGLKYGANEPGFDEDKSGIRYIRITDLNRNGGLRNDTFKSLPFEKALPYLLKEGDILLARSGATVGKSFIYNDSFGQCCYAGYLIRARLDKRKIIPEYFKFFTESSSYWDYVSSSNIQATIQNVSAEKYAGLKIPLYDLEKQKEIVSRIHIEKGKYLKTTYLTQESIKKLKEFKTSLITEAVTGQLDIGAWKNKNTADRSLDEAIQESAC